MPQTPRDEKINTVTIIFQQSCFLCEAAATEAGFVTQESVYSGGSHVI